ncbi:nuclear transport factor 2 family protein [Nocardia concava]|uniref:nuclear transport factor 2 family protein n=1 Tax=Nocardia concava TaxID=257281 RepID=UPI0003154C3B|nr:nuclear transport factor 2 family protein [Nocardia concava]
MRDYGIELFTRWTNLWNGDLDLVDEIMAPEFTLRYAQPGASDFDEIRDRAALAAKIDKFRAERPGLEYSTQGVPVVEMTDARSGIVARPYGARIVQDGIVVRDLSGTDILRFENGQIVEVWSVSGGAEGRSFYA